MTRLLAIAVVLLVLSCPIAHAQQCPGGVCPAPGWSSVSNQTNPGVRLRREFPFIGKIGCPDSTGRWLGTGTIIARDETHSYIITAHHVIRDGGPQVYFYPPGQQRVLCEIVQTNSANDWALLRSRKLEIKPAKCALLEDVAIQPGDEVAAYGYASGQFSSSSGVVKQFVSGDDGRTWNMVETTCIAMPGMSGGPIVGTNGHVIGVITGYGDGRSVGPCLPRLRAVIRKLLPQRRRTRPVLVVNPPAIPLPTAPLPDIPGFDPLPTAPCPDIIEFETRITEKLLEIEARIDALHLKAGPPGKDGVAGPPGPRGPAGSDSIPIDLQAWADANPISVELYDTNGEQIDQTTVSLGGTLKLQLYERTE